VLRNGRDHFDVFDVRLYQDLYNIPGRVEYFRSRMADLGYEKPIVCTEFNGPYFFSFPENTRYAPLMNKGEDERKAFDEAYSNMADLPPQTQMFMFGCPKEVESRFRRIQVRDTVKRCILMLSAGVQKSYYFKFQSEPKHGKGIGRFLFGKMNLVEFDDGAVTARYPLADAYQQLGERLGDVELLKRIRSPNKDSIYVFKAERTGRGPIYIAWARRDDVFLGEEQPAVRLDLEWRFPNARAVDALSKPVPVKVQGGRLSVNISVTPIYIEPEAGYRTTASAAE
jgi:hypothetical protein